MHRVSIIKGTLSMYLNVIRLSMILRLMSYLFQENKSYGVKTHLHSSSDVLYITACHKSRRAQTDFQIPIQNVTKIGKIILKMFGTLFAEQDSLQKQNIKKFSPALPNKDVYVSALSLLIYIVAAASFFIKQKGHNCNPGNFSDHFTFVRMDLIIICLLEKKIHTDEQYSVCKRTQQAKRTERTWPSPFVWYWHCMLCLKNTIPEKGNTPGTLHSFQLFRK
jgi:hypothetical protein